MNDADIGGCGWRYKRASTISQLWCSWSVPKERNRKISLVESHETFACLLLKIWGDYALIELLEIKNWTLKGLTRRIEPFQETCESVWSSESSAIQDIFQVSREKPNLSLGPKNVAPVESPFSGLIFHTQRIVLRIFIERNLPWRGSC